MVKRLIGILLLVISFVTLVGPELAETFNHTAKSISSVHGDEIQEANSEKSLQADFDCSGVCGDANHVTHHCHFGHCGILSTPATFSLLKASSFYPESSPHFFLQSFLSSPYRPPIA